MGTRQPSEHPVLVSVPRLSADEAFAFFTRRCANSEIAQAQRSEIFRLISILSYNPFSISLASACFQTFWDVTAIQSTDYVTPDKDDHFMSLLTSLLIEEAGMNRRLFLIFLFLLGGGTTPLEVVNLCQRLFNRRRDLQRGTEFLSISNVGPTINHWTSLGLLQRQNSPLGTIFIFRSSTAMAMEQEILKDPEQTRYILELSLRLLVFGMDEIGSLSSTNIAKYIEKTISSLRNLCTVAKNISFSLPTDSVSHLQISSFYYLDKSISEGRLLFKKMFWRQWLSSFNYPPPAYLTSENEIATDVPILQWPTWLETVLQNSDFKSIDFRDIIQDEIVAKLRDDLERATWLCGVGNAWFGVRTHVFDFARQNFHVDFSKGQKASFIDFIDKGGTEGVQTKLVSITRSQDFREEVEGMIGSGAVEEIVQVICAISHTHMSFLSKEVIQKAISEALEGTMYETFIEAGSVFTSALLPIQDVIESIIGGLLEVPSDGENARILVSFGVSEAGGQLLQERYLALAEGFCEYLYAAKMWIAAKICLHLAYAAADENKPTREVHWDWICAIIEVAREGVCPVERVPDRKAKVAGQRMLCWLEEAHRCRNA